MSIPPPPELLGPAPARRSARVGVALVVLWLAVAIAAAGGLTGRAGANAPHAATGPTTTSTAPASPSGPERAMELRGQTPFVSQNDQLVLKIAFHCGGCESAATLAFQPYNPLNNEGNGRDLLDQWLSGKPATQALSGLGSVPVAFYADRRDGTDPAALDIGVGIQSSGPSSTNLVLTDYGVYPLGVTMRVDGEVKDQFTTFVVVLPKDRTNVPALQVVPVVAFRSPPALQPDGTTAYDPAIAERLQRATTLLGDDRLAGSPLTLDAQAETVEGLAHVTPGTGTALGTRTLQQLSATLAAGDRRELLASAYVDVDVDAWVGSNMTDELTRQRILAAETLNARLQPTGPARQRTWIARRGLGGAALAKLRELGVDELVVPTASTDDLNGRGFDVSQAQTARRQSFDIDTAAGPMRTLTLDDRLAGRLAADPNPAIATQAAIADLAVIYCGETTQSSCKQIPSATRVVVFEAPEDAASAPALANLLATLQASLLPTAGGPILRTVTLQTAFDQAPAKTPRTDDPLVRSYRPTDLAPGITMGGYPQQLATGRRSVSGYRSMVEDTQPDRATALDQLLDISGAAIGDAGQQRYLDAVRHAVDDAFAGIVVPDQEQVTITDLTATIPIRLENHLDYEVRVLIQLSSDSLEFSRGRQFEVSLPPAGATRQDLQVKVRSPGIFRADVAVFTPVEGLPIASTRFSVRSTAVSGVGLALTIGAGCFLLIWWIRNFRNARRANKLIGRTNHATATAPGGSGADPPRPM